MKRGAYGVRQLGVALVEAFIANLQRWKVYQSYAQPQHSIRSAFRLGNHFTEASFAVTKL